MNNIRVLDCTLRDGGYCNQWLFGFDNAKRIIQCLCDANIDIIECGFLTQNVCYNSDITKYTTIEESTRVIPKDRKDKLFVAMMNYGEFCIDDLPPYDGLGLDGIRVAFHKKDVLAALEVCRSIKQKGYKVFIQAMVSLYYSDEEFLELIRAVNDFEPFAFYIVDSFGMMKRKNLMRLFYTMENNLKPCIWIGFHSHNNMQLAYSNAQSLVDIRTNRNIIIDVSIYGMGRGAGNLNTELFVEYLNENINTAYVLKPLLTVIDEVLNDFYQRNYWGYSLPNYLSAVHWIHPNYAGYLSEKNTLTIEAMDEIFSLMPRDKCFEFDKSYIEDLYVQYMATGRVQEEHKTELKKVLHGKKVLLIAPGKSTFTEKNIIKKFCNNTDVVVISVNFDYKLVEVNYIFLSNLRRFRELDENKRYKCIVTSNIPADRVYLQTSYFDLLNTVEAVRDNAGLMAIQFLINMGVNDIYLAGFDGYSHEVEENYASRKMVLITKNAVIDAMNDGMHIIIKRLRKYACITFITSNKYIN